MSDAVAQITDRGEPRRDEGAGVLGADGGVPQGVHGRTTRRRVTEVAGS